MPLLNGRGFSLHIISLDKASFGGYNYMRYTKEAPKGDRYEKGNTV